MTRVLPPSASVAEPQEDGTLYAPSAARNAGPIAELVRQHAPAQGIALEIASGTGQHVIAFARATPGLSWQPTDIDARRRASIDAHAAQAGLTNITKARALDATMKCWSRDEPPCDMILVVNLLHLLSPQEARTAVTEAAQALAPGGVLILYGPFRRSGQLVSQGDIRFDAELRAADPDIGYKDDLDIARWLSDAGLSPIDKAEMPANNLGFIARKGRP